MKTQLITAVAALWYCGENRPASLVIPKRLRKVVCARLERILPPIARYAPSVATTSSSDINRSDTALRYACMVNSSLLNGRCPSFS